MKKISALLLLLGTLVFGAFGQNDTSSRPRVAPTATPPRILNAPPPVATQSGPPTLIGGSRPVPAPTATPEGEDEVIRVETNLVTMPVSVLDRDGRFISGLQQKDFKIFEDGVEQRLDFFQSVEQPFTVVLLIDVSPSTQFKIEEIQNAAITFVNQLRPADKVMVVAFDQRVTVMCQITNDRRILHGAIRQAQFGDGTSLYEAVDFVIEQQLSRIQGRKAVVLFTDGVDTTSRKANFESTLRQTEEIDSLFYTIRYDTSSDMAGGNPNPGPTRGTGRGGRVSLGDILGAIIMGGNVSMGGGRGRGGANSAEYVKGREYLEKLATNSGGRMFEAQSIYNVDAAFAGIAEELRRQYSIGYYPETVGKVGDRKQIKIRVMRPNVVVRAKNSYVVGQADRNVAGR
jgi:VWFA-related protein